MRREQSAPASALAQRLCDLGVDVAHGRYEGIRRVVRMLGGEWQESDTPVARMPQMVVGMPTPGMDSACMVMVGFIVFGPAWASVPEMQGGWKLFHDAWKQQSREGKRRAVG